MDDSGPRLGLIDTTDWAVYTAATPLLRDHALACLGAGQQVQSALGFAERSLDCHAVIVVSQGRGEYTDRRVGTVRVVAPAVITVRPGVRHTYRPDAGGWTEHWLLLTGSALVVAEATGLFQPGRPVVPLIAIPDLLTEWLDTIATGLVDPDPAAGLLAAGAAQQLLASLSLAQPDHGELLLPGLRRRATEPLSVDQRARALGVDARELQQRVREQTGQSVHELVISARIEASCLLLASTTVPIGEVAQRVGYADPAYFSRLFTDRMGVSPSRFRDAHSRSDPGEVSPAAVADQADPDLSPADRMEPWQS